ncbi:MAG: hypothetical protein RMJ35_08330 [Phycisphaerales bacterium]|nr:hypothetical protein [Phycisphaerales bacterium]
MKPFRKTILSQPSWGISTREVALWLTQTGGMLGPVSFHFGRRQVLPFSVAPWHSEKLDSSIPPILRVLRGDFFCMPFGANTTRFGREHHPIHGECANGRWKLVAGEQSRDGARLECTFEGRIRKVHVRKIIELRSGHHAIYQRHVVTGAGGPMCFGQHAMLKFPDAPGSGLISTSPFKLGQVFPEPVERPENRGYSALRPGAEFESLTSVMTLTGEPADLSTFPARRGFEDLVILAADDLLEFAWSAVVIPSQRWVWFSIRDPKVLASTILWISNGGRHYPPWNGRHVNVMGIEDVTANFHYGLAESVQENPLSRRGVRTCVELKARAPLVVNHIMAVAEVPAGFDRVEQMAPGDGGVTLRSTSGTGVYVPLDLSWLRGGS